MVICLRKALTERRSAVLWTVEMVGEGTPVDSGQRDTLRWGGDNPVVACPPLNWKVV